MAVNLSPVGGVAAQFFDNSGNVLTGGKIYTYLAGTTTPATTYTSSNGATAWSNPIVLDASGRVSGSGEIWLTDGIQYKFLLKDSNDVLIATYDNIVGINSNFVNFTNQQEIQTATAGQTVFNLTTMAYQPGTNSLSVFVDGVNQYGPGAQYAYVETDADTITFVSGLHVGAEVKFTTSSINSSAATDASQVSYVPPFLDSVATNVEDRLAQYVSVKDFGAVGDGVTDDTTAIQNALNYVAAGGSSVIPPQPWACQLIFPAGNYRITTTLLVPRGISIVGENARTHSGCVIVQETAGEYIFDLYGFLYDTNRRTADQKISGLKFSSAGGAIRAVASDYPGDTISIGSLTITDNHFLDVNGDYAILTDKIIETVSGNTFDYCAVGHIKTAGGKFENNMFFQGISGAIVIDCDYDPLNYGYTPTLISGNQFVGNGGFTNPAPYNSAIVLLGNSTIYSLSILGNTFSSTSTGAGTNGIQSDTNVGIRSANISGNTFSRLEGNGILLSHVYNSKIDNNLFYSCGNTIAGTYICGLISDSVGNTISYNNFSSCGGSYNIYVGAGGSAGNSIEFNKEDTSRIEIVSSSAVEVNYLQSDFTPSVYFGTTDVTVSYEDCKYTKIGRLVCVCGQITFNRTTNTGTMTITGFPPDFPSNDRIPIFAQEGVVYPVNYTNGMFIDNTNVVYFVGASGLVTASDSNIAAGNKTILFNFNYQI